MGFRSNYIAECSGYKIPEWFKEKYPELVFKEDGQRAFAQLFESKFYNLFAEDERFIDIQKLLVWNNENGWGGDSIHLVLLHECNGITLIKITPNSITGREPTAWKEVEAVEHNYCYGCSEASVLSTPTSGDKN